MPADQIITRPFRLPAPGGGAVRRSLQTLITPAAERLLCFPRLNDIYAAAVRKGGGERFFGDVLDEFNVRVEIDEDRLQQIPREGPLVVVANHPFGGIDGVTLMYILQRVRPDFRVLLNYLLGVMPEFDRASLYVDPFDTPGARRRNVRVMRQALEWVTAGNALGVFPAGEVSHATWKRMHVSDPPWSSTVGRLVQKSGATVVPLFFDGRNSMLFQLAGLIHPRLRTAMLPRELCNTRRSTLRIEVGHPISPQRLAQLSSVDAVTSYLRVRTYLLGHASANGAPTASDPRRTAPAPLRAAQDAGELAAEIDRLDQGQKLIQHKDFGVYWADADQIPLLIKELGRERERAFRLVGEGTGKASDIDRFDAWYVHLFVWNHEKRELVGAYRLGPTDQILPRHSVSGFYTHTLFQFDPRLMEQLDPALELGRSFIRPEYQRAFAPLMLLWKGIGCYVAANPRYRRLFGPVSISAEYQSMSKKLLMLFLEQNRYLASLAQLIKPRNPVIMQPDRDWEPSQTSIVVSNIDEVDELIREVERELRGVPVLVRQYLKLDARLLGFNLDPEFGNVIDGLMYADLTTISRRALVHYMGKENARAYLEYHTG